MTNLIVIESKWSRKSYTIYENANLPELPSYGADIQVLGGQIAYKNGPTSRGAP